MRIGIDARMLGSGYGIGRYIEQLIAHLLKIDRENEYVLFVLGVIAQFKIQNSKFKIVEVSIPWYSWQEQVKLTAVIRREKINLMHFPHWNVPLTYTDPFVVTIHDLTMFHYPRPEATTLGPARFWVKDTAHRLVTRHAARAAKQIAVTSEFTKQDVHSTLGVPLEKMTVTYQAPFQISDFVSRNDDQVNQKSKVENFKSPYVLYVGAAYPHKNLEGLLKAWQIFLEKYGAQCQLVLVGKEDYFYQRLKQSAMSYELPAVSFIGLVTDFELSLLYQHASLFVFPSLYEGFGLPPLEAMAHGVPVVASSRACLPEILGEAALYVDPENPAQLAEALHQGLTDQNIRALLKERAREELRRYSWEKLASETLALYRRAFHSS